MSPLTGSPATSGSNLESPAVVPAGCLHAFANPTDSPVRMLFLVSPPGHEHYLDEIGEVISRGGPPDPAVIAGIRARHDLQQLTPMVAGRR